MISTNICNNKIILKLRSIQGNFRFKFETFEFKREIGIYYDEREVQFHSNVSLGVSLGGF